MDLPRELSRLEAATPKITHCQPVSTISPCIFADMILGDRIQILDVSETLDYFLILFKKGSDPKFSYFMIILDDTGTFIHCEKFEHYTFIKTISNSNFIHISAWVGAWPEKLEKCVYDAEKRTYLPISTEKFARIKTPPIYYGGKFWNLKQIEDTKRMSLLTTVSDFSAWKDVEIEQFKRKDGEFQPPLIYSRDIRFLAPNYAWVITHYYSKPDNEIEYLQYNLDTLKLVSNVLIKSLYFDKPVYIMNEIFVHMGMDQGKSSAILRSHDGSWICQFASPTLYKAAIRFGLLFLRTGDMQSSHILRTSSMRKQDTTIKQFYRFATIKNTTIAFPISCDVNSTATFYILKGGKECNLNPRSCSPDLHFRHE